MIKNLGQNVSHTFSNENYNFDSVVFQAGRPILDSELNLEQQLQQDLLRKTASFRGSGWVSYKKPFAEPGLGEVFYTQDPNTAEPEIAVVNGWPVYVANTNTIEEHANKIDLSEFPLAAGSRADGVFLEVWRGLVDDQMSGITAPTDTSIVGTLRSVCAVDNNVAWAVGENGILLKTDNGGVTWLTQPAPTSYTIREIKFLTQKIGLLVGDGGSLYKTDNGGTSWVKLGVPVSNDLYGIHIVDQSLVVIVGSRGTVLRSQDMYNFELITGTEQAADDLLSVYFYDKMVGWACGRNGLYLRTLDGGKTWKRYSISIPDESNPSKEKKVTTKLNGVRFVNLSDGWVVGDGGLILRTTDGGLRWANVSESIYSEETGSYTRTTQNLNGIEIIKSYPLRIELTLFNTSQFSSASYRINPTYLELFYRKTGEGETDVRIRLNLADYEKDADLVQAINSLRDVEGNRIFEAALSYSDTAYLSHEESENISGNESAEIRFSMGDIVWIVGNGGTVLTSQNGGARWTQKDAKISFDAFGVSFRGSSIGWVVGAQGEISKYDSSLLSDPWVAQDTDLVQIIQRKVYAHGNLSSPSTLNLINNAVHPDIKVETAARTQIQYRIRVVEGVDIQANRDAGLGAPYVFSKGPNSSVLGAGSYSFENMGSVNGDYGLWRAPCRNTVDGYTYAIPMFIITRRNQRPYNPNTNINGSSVETLNAIRPDGLVYEDIVAEDILDVRRNIANFIASEALGRTVDDLLKGVLRTSLGSSPGKGGQVGSLITYVEESGEATMDNILDGSYNTQAILVDPVYIGGSAEGVISPEEDEPALVSLSFPPLIDGMYHNNISFFSAVYAVDDNPLLDGTEIPGFFSGMGTAQVTFTFDEEVEQGNGISYVIQGAYVDYSKKALINNPTHPLQVKNFQQGAPDSSVNYLAIDDGVQSKVVRRLSSGVRGLYDYAEASAETFGDSQDLCASKVRLHLYQEVTSNTTEIQVPKNVEGYFLFAVREIRNVKDGGVYKMLKIDGSSEDTLRVHLSTTYMVVEGSIIEIIAEVTTDEGLGIDVGNFSQNNGETLEAVRNGNIAVFNSGVKGVQALYKSILLEVSLDGGAYPVPAGISAMGIASMPRLEGRVPYAWKIEDNNITETIAISFSKDDDGQITQIEVEDATESILVCLLITEGEGIDGANVGVRVSYKSPAPQTLSPLPSSLSLEVIEGPKNMIVSSLGSGGGISNPYYRNPLIGIPNPINGITNQSFFYNLFGLDFENFSDEEGYVTLPLRVTRQPGQEIILSSPGLDNYGRSYYKTSSETLVLKSEGMLIGNPRKILVPFLVRVSSIITTPVLTGEVLLAIATTVKNEELDNEIRLGPSPEGSIIALYKVPGMPLIK